MRGEHCIAGASVLSAIAIILLVFVNIGQIGTGALVSGIYMAQVNVAAYGAAVQAATKSTPNGLYDTQNNPLGTSAGLRQYYRYGIYRACAYQKDGSGICSDSSFGHPMEPYGDVLADTPSKFKSTFNQIVPNSTYKNDSYNSAMTRIGGLLIFVGSALAAVALILGVLKSKVFFFGAATCSGLSAFLLLIGATLWTACIAQDSSIADYAVAKTQNLGITTTAGAGLYLTWAAFVFVTLSVLPYVIACCTFRRD
ncbi:actin cortical patch SUR7/pH-response regulator pali [Kockovaella imperatae]|uniref:Actin cortical patch SUR7/pH-response regulator pali n=1 Tax=Kockovaella imperatae TaxID=4999 RepID=A0A1Y1UGN7_9TREE|nr:actin cortical patch SUR7/pH-response regulator pali [Kockovaella imperatae]ORX37231.1 actin cortical patch SUR7/pH-response regulator pali [Kockovaella imperatae]